MYSPAAGLHYNTTGEVASTFQVHQTRINHDMIVMVGNGPDGRDHPLIETLPTFLCVPDYGAFVWWFDTGKRILHSTTILSHTYIQVL